MIALGVFGAMMLGLAWLRSGKGGWLGAKVRYSDWLAWRDAMNDKERELEELRESGAEAMKLARSGFGDAAIVRDLSRAEILLRKLPLKWHGEFWQDLPVKSSITGDFNVPKGFITDGASVPRVLWNVLSDTDPDILYPAYAHDLLYSLKGKLPDKPQITIADADAVIRELMLAIGAPVWKAQMVYHVLRAHNGSKWQGATAAKRASIKLARVKPE